VEVRVHDVVQLGERESPSKIGTRPFLSVMLKSAHLFVRCLITLSYFNSVVNERRFCPQFSKILSQTQTKKQTATEDTLAAKIKCKDFQQNSDARIGKIDFSSHTFGVGEVDIGGVDLATVLNRKCLAN